MGVIGESLGVSQVHIGRSLLRLENLEQRGTAVLVSIKTRFRHVISIVERSAAIELKALDGRQVPGMRVADLGFRTQLSGAELQLRLRARSLRALQFAAMRNRENDVLQRLSAVRGSINSLMAELMEDHIRHHMPRNSKSSEEAADDVIQIVRTNLK
jgi:Metal-sensitive transcriptional repressor